MPRPSNRHAFRRFDPKSVISPPLPDPASCRVTRSTGWVGSVVRKPPSSTSGSQAHAHAREDARTHARPRAPGRVGAPGRGVAGVSMLRTAGPGVLEWRSPHLLTRAPLRNVIRCHRCTVDDALGGDVSRSTAFCAVCEVSSSPAIEHSDRCFGVAVSTPYRGRGWIHGVFWSSCSHSGGR